MSNQPDLFAAKPKRASSKAHTQCNVILDYMRKKPINTQIARELGILALPRRICDLKEAGNMIHTEMVEVESQWGKTRIAFYYLIAERVQP